jgi:acetyltransferase
VDVLAGSGPATYTLALEALLTDETVDAVVVIQAPQDWFLPASLAEVVGETAGLHNKPVIASIMGKASVDEALNILHKRRVPNVAFPERAASILSAMVQRKEWMNSDYLQPEDAAEFIPADTESMIQNEQWEKLVEAYGIKLPEQRISKRLDCAIEASNQIGYPVVMKLIAKNHSHKSDIGGVQINLRDDEEVKNAWRKINESAEKANAKMDGVVIQKMLNNGQEVIIGIKQDEQFGPLVLFGTGGTDVELYKDVQTAIAPLSDSEATQLINSTIAGKKLKGWRNLPPADIQEVKKVLISMSRLAVNHPEIKEMEMNPLFVLEEGKGAFAVDIRGSK